VTVKALLIAGRDIISVPSQWTQKSYAKNADGIHCAVMSEDATCWCSDGVLFKAQGEASFSNVYIGAFELLSKIAKEHDPLVRSIISFNDAHSHSEVIAVWDEAILRANRL